MTRNGDSPLVRDVWDKVAERWDEFVETGLDTSRLYVHGPALLEVCGDMRGLKVLDLGCGQGYFSRLMAKGGARVSGVDISRRMISLAKHHEAQNHLGIDFRVLDAESVDDAWPPGSFDLVSACMSLHDMPHPDAVIRAGGRVLKDGGAMAFSVVHPFVNVPSGRWEINKRGEKTAIRVKNYFGIGAYAVPWTMARLKHHWQTVSYHHTLADWSRMIERGGFVVERMLEPRPTKSQIRAHPELGICSGLPFFLVFGLRKGMP